MSVTNLNKFNDLNMSIKQSLMCLIATGLTGCATVTDVGKQPLDNSNYKDKAQIEKKDISIYLADYVGTEENCFPKIDGRRCYKNVNGSSPYRVTKELMMEVFEVRLDNNGFENLRVKDFAFLIASDVAIERSFKYFTLTRTTETTGCSTSYQANTNGYIAGDSYYGSTVLSEQQGCVAKNYYEFLLLNDPIDLGKGVFKKVNSGVWAGLGMVPFESLYFSTMQGHKYADFNPTSTIQVGSSTARTHVYTPSNAWKSIYDAKGMSLDLRAKYGVTDKNPYKYLDEAKTNKSKMNNEVDVIEKNKISN